jgi:hypothetical protein
VYIGGEHMRGCSTRMEAWTLPRTFRCTGLRRCVSWPSGSAGGVA